MLRTTLVLAANAMLVVCGLTFSSCWNSLMADELAERPNIILVLADDQGWGDVGYNGHPALQTPNLDQMASQGIRFDRFYAAAPVCSPTRANLLTGRHPNRMGAFSWGNSLRPQELTLAEILSEHGYATAHFGKWHVGSVLSGSPVNPGNSGFGEWVSSPNFFDFSPLFSHNGKVVETSGEGSENVVDFAIDYLENRENVDQPFFLAIWFGNPHLPHLATEDDRLLYSEFSDDLANFYGEVTEVDRAFGTLRAYLAKSGLKDNTILWYLSDNGGLQDIGRNGGRSGKGSIYEGGIRVPSIIEWPRVFPDPKVVISPASTSDVLPTLLDAANIEYPESRPLDGISLVEIMNDETTVSPRPIMFWNFYDSSRIPVNSNEIMLKIKYNEENVDLQNVDDLLYLDAAVIQKRYESDFYIGHAAILEWPWKLHRIEKSSWYDFFWGSAPSLELYNLVDDPLEENNLINERSELALEMQVDLELWQASVLSSLNGDDY